MDKRHHPLDDLFRQGLRNLEIKPTETGRSGFLKKADREKTKRSRRSGWLTGTGIILGILLTGAIVFFYNSNENQTSNKPVEPVKNNPSGPDGAHGQTISKPAIGVTTKSTDITGKKQYITYPPINNNSKVAINSKPEDYTSQKRYVDNLSVLRNSPSSIADSSSSNSKQLQASGTFPQPPIPLPKKGEEANEKTDSINKKAEIIPDKDTGHYSSSPVHNREWKILAGIYFSPEWVFNTLDDNKYVNNFGLEGQFRFGPYSVRTGVGLSITRGYNEIVIETKSYLGGYNALDHITYHWDAKHYHLLPTYYTTWKEVYDTALHKNYYTLEKEYTYLQIPMILGYDFFTDKWFSLGARVGPVMSLLLKTKELTSEYNAGKDQVISINNVTPDRIHLNWQAMGGINASFHLSELITFELEPGIKYYFNSVYEKSGPSGKPWSVGIRGTFLVNF